MVKSSTHSVKEFAQLIYSILKSDRGVNLACSGEPGEGKSTFLLQLQKEYARIAGVSWDFNYLTWDRSEFLKWIDGEDDSKKGRLPEYSAILADELITMFFGQEWYESEQKDSIKVLNMCRDRHLFIAGNTPNFFDLNGRVRDRFTFYCFVPERGVAWVFRPEKNPFVKDRWNTTDNIKIIRRKGVEHSPNFAFKVKFDDLSDEEEELYKSVRNSKRVTAMNDIRNKRDASNFGKKDEMLGKALVAFVEHSGSPITAVAEKVGLHPDTARKYYNMMKMELSKKNGKT